MEFLGKVDGTADDGTAVVIGTEAIPEIGNPVFDSDKRRVGAVRRVFGPVKEPFVLVSVEDAAASGRLRGKDLYVIRRTQNGKDKRRYRRD